MKTQITQEQIDLTKDYKNFLKVVKRTPAKYFKNRTNQNLIFYYENGEPIIYLTTDYYSKIMISNCPIKTQIIDNLKYEIMMIDELF